MDLDPRERYDEICDDLVARHAEVALGQMIGMPAIKADGKLIGGFARSEGAMVFKLPDEGVRAEALALEGAHLFDPAGGRPMKEWVVVPSAHEARWPGLAETALALRAR